jgi:hypothetical protein
LTGDRAYLRRVLAEEIWPGGKTPLWDAMDEAMSSLAGESGRRVILAVTDGFDSTTSSMPPFTPVGPVTPRGRPRRYRFQGGPVDSKRGRHVEVTRRAVRENFMVYGVGHADWLPMERVFSGQMMSLATDSGGGFRVFPAGQDAKQAMVQVAEELHRQYLIGFTPTAIDNKIHKLNVRVKRPGHVRSGRGRTYLADGK